MGSPLAFWFFRTITLFSLLFCGYNISFGKRKHFSYYAIIAIAVYSIIEGLRWDRGPDYMHYYNDYIGRWVTKDPEPLYLIIVNTMNLFSFPYWMAFIVYSIILITPLLLILKKYRQFAVWCLPIFYLVTFVTSENLIRQYIATGFMLFAYFSYINKRYYWAAILSICVPLVHLSGVVTIFLLIVFILSEKIKFSFKTPLVWVVIYILIFVLWDVSYFDLAPNLINSLEFDQGGKLQNYLDNSDRWFTTEGSLSYVLGRNSFQSVAYIGIKALTDIVVIYYGFYVIKLYPKLRVAYYASILSVYIKILSGDIELYQRFSTWLLIYIPIVLSGILVYMKERSIYERVSVFAIIFMSYGFYNFINLTTKLSYSGYAFIWDK